MVVAVSLGSWWGCGVWQHPSGQNTN